MTRFFRALSTLRYLQITILLGLTALPFLVLAAKSPDSIKGTTLVTAEGFIQLVDTVPDLIIIDSRIPGDRKQGYVEGSISLPDVDTSCSTLAKNIPTKKSAALFYCNGVKCGRSAKAVEIALSCGYTAIYWFRGGFEEWLAKGYPYLQE
ncbi:MAG TPA: rhodanese-like domain-containing protein [Gammaproteobacteria bacterium]